MSAIAPEIADERHSAPVELFWDLVFVFAITQVTTLLWHDLTWAGFGRAMLVLALVWWAWSAFVWATNAQLPNSPTLRASLLASSVAIFITGLSIPHAFGGEGTLFAVSYAIVRFLHLALYIDASRRGTASWSSMVGFMVTVTVGMALLIGGSFTSGWVRIAVWVLAAAIDYAGPAWLTRDRLRGLQDVVVAHFAERYSLFVIICLGESLVAVGVGALGASAERILNSELVVAAALGLLITVAMWWTYFEGFAEAAAERLRGHDDPVLAAADAYSYLHLVIVAGIITFAVGVKILTRGSVTAALPGPARLALCGGVALYLTGTAAFSRRLLGTVESGQLAVAGALLVLYAVGGALAAWVVAGTVAALVGGLCVADAEAVRRVIGAHGGEASSTADERMT
ncbi:MAG: low temperature requirement protein A [Solirubrobacterales bacterium]|nr:low temperature requirement protein A [Solirubrobacterales bacterium]